MGQAKDEMMRMEPWAGLDDYVEALVAGGELEATDAACGVAKLVANKGTEGLSPDQEKVWERHFLDVHGNKSCDICDAHLSWDELTACVGDTPVCSGCQNNMSKDD